MRGHQGVQTGHVELEKFSHFPRPELSGRRRSGVISLTGCSELWQSGAIPNFHRRSLPALVIFVPTKTLFVRAYSGGGRLSDAIW